LDVYFSCEKDQVPPFESETTVRIIEIELGQPVDVIFDRFDQDPVTAASVGMSFLDYCQSHPFAPLL
jgi:hypothetical protein